MILRVSFIKNMKPEEIIPFDYKNLEYYNRNSKEFNDVLFDSVKNNKDIKVLELNDLVIQVLQKQEKSLKKSL